MLWIATILCHAASTCRLPNGSASGVLGQRLYNIRSTEYQSSPRALSCTQRSCRNAQSPTSPNRSAQGRAANFPSGTETESMQLSRAPTPGNVESCPPKSPSSQSNNASAFHEFRAGVPQPFPFQSQCPLSRLNARWLAKELDGYTVHGGDMLSVVDLHSPQVNAMS